MSEDTMSQSQVESLLRAMEQGDTPSPVAKPANPDEAATPKRSANSSTVEPAAVNTMRRGSTKERVTPYDFKQPERVGKEHWRAMHSFALGKCANGRVCAA